VIVYTAVNKINGKRYVGITKRELSRRVAAHINEAKFPFQRALIKYGVQSFEIYVIDSADTWKALCEKEIYWIQFYGCTSPAGYNLTYGGDGSIPTEEVRAKIGVASKGRKMSAKARAAILKANLGNAYTKGSKLSEGHKAKCSAALKGKPCWLKGGHHKEESKLKASASMKGKPSPLKGRKLSPEHIAGIVARNTGSKRSEETKAKMRRALLGHPGYYKGKNLSEEHKAKISAAAFKRWNPGKEYPAQ
jgi:group I intron endonuclease